MTQMRLFGCGWNAEVRTDHQWVWTTNMGRCSDCGKISYHSQEQWEAMDRYLRTSFGQPFVGTPLDRPKFTDITVS
jgi:hypothetical protein